MQTKPRIDFAGYHHIINRGVNKSNIFNHNNDKDMLLQIINKIALRDSVILPTYVLMDNHYHLLIKVATIPIFQKSGDSFSGVFL